MKYHSHVSPSSQRSTSKALPAVQGQHAKLYALLGLPLAAAGLLFLSFFL